MRKGKREGKRHAMVTFDTLKKQSESAIGPVAEAAVITAIE